MVRPKEIFREADQYPLDWFEKNTGFPYIYIYAAAFEIDLEMIGIVVVDEFI